MNDMKTKVSSATMEGHTRLATGFAVLVGAMASLAPGCQKSAPIQLPPPVVQVMEAASTNVPITAEFIGQLDSPQNVQIRARVEAFVKDVLFVEGTNVNAGDPLFALDKQPFEEKLAAAKGVLGEAQAMLKKYETDVNRLTPLAKLKAIPQQDLDNALASVEVGKAAVVSAQAQVQSAEIDLGYCDVSAPISGRIGAKQVSIGELVGKGEPTLMATISTLNPIWFYCSISEVDYLRADSKARETGRRIGELPVTLILADGSEFSQKGHWVFLDRAVDTATGTIRARAQFPNPDEILRPGMFARARVSLKLEQDSILVPQRAVLELQGKNFVWVVGEDNKVTQRPVKVGIEIGGNVIILEGLKAGERIILEGLQKVREGSVVQPMTVSQMAAAAAAQAGNETGAEHDKASGVKQGKE